MPWRVDARARELRYAAYAAGLWADVYEGEEELVTNWANDKTWMPQLGETSVPALTAVEARSDTNARWVE